MLVNTLMKESNGSSLRAEIYQENNGPYLVKYYVNEANVKSSSYNTADLLTVENAVNSWLDSVRLLNG